VARLLCILILRLIGWRTVYAPPPGPKTVILVYPHTSNWDFPLGLLFRFQYPMFIHWAAKDTLFRGPVGAFFRHIGGIPINRRAPAGIVGQIVERFARSASFHVVITPEGTRARTAYWKDGFYRIVRQARVPVGLGFIDYGSRTLGIERWIELSGDEAADLETLRAYYAGKRARHPEQAGEIRFKPRG